MVTLEIRHAQFTSYGESRCSQEQIRSSSLCIRRVVYFSDHFTGTVGHDQIPFNTRKEYFVWPRVDRVHTVRVSWTRYELDVSLPWAYREGTVTLTWEYPELTVRVPWGHRDLNVRVPWAYREHTVGVPWRRHELDVSVPWAYRDLNVRVAWAYREHTVNAPWA